jgi:hypothetical protein
MMRPDEFYAANEGPPRQGDILLAGVSRLVAEDRFTPAGWEPLDTADAMIDLPERNEPLRLAAGAALVMVTSHDCHFDKQWNRVRNRLIRDGMDEDAATRQADGDPALDRTFTASPLVRPDDLRLDRGNLLAARIIGYLPVPPSDDGLVPEAVVDLTYRATLDRLAIARVAGISNAARAQLRYALAHLDALRTPTVGFAIEAVVGRQISDVSFPNRDPLLVRLRLDDGAELDLLQQPGEPGQGPARAAPPAASR